VVKIDTAVCCITQPSSFVYGHSMYCLALHGELSRQVRPSKMLEATHMQDWLMSWHEIKVKANFNLEQVTKARRGSRCIALRFL